MKYITKITALLTITLQLATSACEFGDTNIDPTALPAVESRAILPAAQSQTAYNIGALGGRMPGIVMQHFIGFDAQQIAYTTYNFTESDLNNLWNTGLYVGSMKDCAILIEQGTEEGQPHYVGIAKVILAQNLGLATNFWGDVPYSQAFNIVENSAPAFDTQEQVYASIQQLLDEAIAALSEPASEAGPGADDLIFEGDPALWISTARSLKARYHIQLTKRNPNAATEALAAIIAGAVSSVATQPNFVFGSATTAANPYSQFGQQRPKTLIFNPDFEALLASKADPRKPKYTVQSGSDWLYYESPASANLYWSTNESPIPLISYTETKFIESEARLRTGDVVGAETALNQAIVANMQQLGIAPVDYAAYVLANGNFVGLTSTEQQLERIINEKYVALYAQGETEIWTDFRRTGYPALQPVAEGANGNNPSGVIPRRFVYPIDERLTNSANLQAAKDRQGGDLLDVDMWAFKN